MSEIYEKDAAGHRCLVVKSLRDHPNADNQGHEPGLRAGSGQWLILRPPVARVLGQPRYVAAKEVSPEQREAAEAYFLAHP